MKKESRGGVILIETLFYLLISIIFASMLYELLQFVLLSSKRTIDRVNKEIDFFMAVDYLRMDFWWHAVSPATISPDGMRLSFFEIVQGQKEPKKVTYIVERDKDQYKLKRTSSEGVNVVYTSSKPIYFYSPHEKIWGINIEGYYFEMLNEEPEKVRKELKLGIGELPYFLLPNR
ncbi:hypothetical protein [Pseudothermotoga thermarum]|uniref:Uncharacterized protein n=1 Tax=Pseudothermotoga thermarum DSM 5069 TaxID=688269 RepID=F7YX16_9THEM|nr:hypothetical protein [Pseudothermotoga thermarum]AEH50614.1 hypothetical protein Theth_0525 [Pseudothermotoga thermarum DSM 5069]